MKPCRECQRPLPPQHARHCPVLEAGSARSGFWSIKEEVSFMGTPLPSGGGVARGAGAVITTPAAAFGRLRRLSATAAAVNIVHARTAHTEVRLQA